MNLREDLGPFRRRASRLFFIVLLALAGLVLRLFVMEVVHGTAWRRMAENNRLRRLPIEAPRGRIYDRNGVILAGNRPSYQLLVFPAEMKNSGATCLFLARAGLGSAAELQALLGRRVRGSLAPRIVAEDLSWTQVTWIRAHQSDHPELAVISGLRREYPLGGLTAHVVGYLRRISKQELAADPGARPDTLLGATGIEEAANRTLAGRPGERRVVVTAIGRQIGQVSETPAVAGSDLTLTLDLGLQRVAAEAMGDRQGAVVALDPENGAVRVLYSAPVFDPNLFTAHLTAKAWAALRDDPSHPLQNRCTQGVYPPGSTIKPFYALEALVEGAATPGWTVRCTGSTVLYGHTFHCWRRSGHGLVAMRRALEVSCDSYFYRLGLALGIESMARWLGRFGFGQPTGLGLSGERTGLVATPEWMERVRHHPWYPGTTVSVAIGQGPILATPVQLARAYAALANGGRLVVPHLVEGPGTATGVDLGIPPRDLEVVREGLDAVVHGREGTARALAALPVAGKTGTAQVARLTEGVRLESMEYRLRHHALFVGWAPVGDPRLVVAVVVEHGGGGASAAAPVAAAVLKAALAEERAPSGPGVPRERAGEVR